jgi:hypothetical protein
MSRISACHSGIDHTSITNRTPRNGAKTQQRICARVPSTRSRDELVRGTMQGAVAARTAEASLRATEQRRVLQPAAAVVRASQGSEPDGDESSASERTLDGGDKRDLGRHPMTAPDAVRTRRRGLPAAPVCPSVALWRAVASSSLRPSRTRHSTLRERPTRRERPSRPSSPRTRTRSPSSSSSP